MKLILAIVSNDDANNLIKALSKAKYQTTKLATTGGFLSKGNSTIITGCEDEQVEEVMDIISKESRKHEEFIPSTMPLHSGEMLAAPIKVTVGGATVFVLNVEDFKKL